MRVLSKVKVIAAASLLVVTLSFSVHAQKDAIDKGKTTAGSGSVGGGIKTGGTKVHRERERIVHVTPTTGALTIVAEPGASIRLEHLKRNGEVADFSEDTIPEGEKSIVLNKLAPGEYRVVAELSGYHQAISNKAVKANNSDKVELNLVPITYNVTVSVNAPSGTISYSKGSEVPRVIPFQNNQATLSNLTGGNYRITIKPDDDSYQPLAETLSVSSDNVLSRTLVKREESKEFSATTASDWSLPGGWSFVTGRMRVNGNGVAVPSDSNFRNYKNFHLNAVVTMLNGVGVSIAIHEVDPQNYYLVQITGPNSDDPYKLRGYIVKNGSLQRFGRATAISQFSKTLTSPKGFQLILTMEGSVIDVKVFDTTIGELLSLGTLADPGNAFTIGAVGVAARDNEQNEIGMFIICSAEKMRLKKCTD